MKLYIIVVGLLVLEMRMAKRSFSIRSLFGEFLLLGK